MMNKKHGHIDYKSLVSQYQKGDKEALSQLIRNFHPRLKQTIYMATRNKEAVDETPGIPGCCAYGKKGELKAGFWRKSLTS